jgi:uncharacterized protein (DUF1697 family)
VIRVALLRGINVGGHRRMEMARLRSTIERAGARRVHTYIASGNVIFDDDRPKQELTAELEAAIASEFGFDVPLLVLDIDKMRRIREAIPDDWLSDKTMRADAWFLWPDADEPDVIERLPVRDGVDEVRYVPGAVLWTVEAEQLTRSGRTRMVGTVLYRSVTVRSVNTVRKLTLLMQSDAEQGLASES